ncbi:MAG: AAA family ATPase [Muribaculaceae bacterium]|nr:AAA family ATPase [Muribaculaceae bacterium]
MISRDITPKLVYLASKFPIVTLTGPRQSGKSTLLKNLFSEYRYVSLENPDLRELATNDPNGFLATYSNKVILDEIQRVPSLFSYLQTVYS